MTSRAILFDRAGDAAADTADERWAAWVAEGVEHDRRTRTRLYAAAVIASGLIFWLTVVLTLF